MILMIFCQQQSAPTNICVDLRLRLFEMVSAETEGCLKWVVGGLFDRVWKIADNLIISFADLFLLLVIRISTKYE